MSFRVFFFLYRVYFYTYAHSRHRLTKKKADTRHSVCQRFLFTTVEIYLLWQLCLLCKYAFFLWKLNCDMCVPWILYHPNDPALARGNSKSSRRSCSWLSLHPFWTGKMRLCVLFRFDLISKTAAPTVYYTVGRSCVSIISLFGQFTRRLRSVSKGTRVTVTQSAYCRDKQTGLIQPKQHY